MDECSAFQILNQFAYLCEKNKSECIDGKSVVFAQAIVSLLHINDKI